MPGQDKQQEKLNMTDESKTSEELGDANIYSRKQLNAICNMVSSPVAGHMLR